MSKKSLNPRRVAYEKKQEEQGKNIVNGIFIVLGILAVAFAVWSVWLVG